MTYGYNETVLERIIVPPKIDHLILDDFTLAFFMGYRNKTLWYLLHKKAEQYDVFQIPKKNGRKRTIHAPKSLMKNFLRQAHTRLLLPMQEGLGKHVTAYRPKLSIVDAVSQHIPKCPKCDSAPKGETPNKHECPKQGAYIHMDLRDFFTSTRRAWIRRFFMEEGYSFYVSGLLANLLCIDDIPNPKFRGSLVHSLDRRDAKTVEDIKTFSGIPQGSPASGAICNLVADKRIDWRILQYMKELNKEHKLSGSWAWRYTRYADDLSITCGKDFSRDYKKGVTEHIEKLVGQGGYRINRKKTRIASSYYRRTMLGIVFNQKTNIAREEYMRVRAMVHNCLTQGMETQFVRAGKSDTESLITYLRGKINHIGQVHQERGNKLKEEFEVALKNYRDKEEGKG